MTESAVPDAAREATVSIVSTQLERLAQIAAELGDHALATEARAEDDRLVEARFFVACLGQFKRGKSTLINALVGQPILPVGVVPVTSVVTILRYGDQPAALVRFTDGRSEEIALDTIAEFIDERRNPDNRRGAAAVEIVFQSATLDDGLCLVDTPGLGSIHAANTEATRAFVPRIDVALMVVGPDPPISGAELDLLRDVVRESGELIVVLNKSDQVSPEQLREVVQFTRTTIESVVGRPLDTIFQLSAFERLSLRTATRDWEAFEDHLRTLSRQARERLVQKAGERSVQRLARRLGVELTHRDEALRKPVAEIQMRANRLRAALDDLDQSLIELRFLFDAAEADLGTQFDQHRTRFFRDNASDLRRRMTEWISRQSSTGRTLRRQAFEEAHRMVARTIEQWFEAIEPEAHALYRAATERLVRLANDYIARIAADAADVDADELPSEFGFRARRQFYFTSLMHATGGSPMTWLIDRFAPRTVRHSHIARAADAYLTHLLESNSHRVENDLRDRTTESRRWLEGEIRARLVGAFHSAERAVAVATEKQQMSELELSERVERVRVLREELSALTR